MACCNYFWLTLYIHIHVKCYLKNLVLFCIELFTLEWIYEFIWWNFCRFRMDFCEFFFPTMILLLISISILCSKIELLCIKDIISTRDKRSSTSLLLESLCVWITSEYFVGIGIFLKPLKVCLTVTSIITQLIRIRMLTQIFIFILLNVLLKTLEYMTLSFLQYIWNVLHPTESLASVEFCCCQFYQSQGISTLLYSVPKYDLHDWQIAIRRTQSRMIKDITRVLIR